MITPPPYTAACLPPAAVPCAVHAYTQHAQVCRLVPRRLVPGGPRSSASTPAVKIATLHDIVQAPGPWCKHPRSCPPRPCRPQVPSRSFVAFFFAVSEAPRATNTASAYAPCASAALVQHDALTAANGVGAAGNNTATAPDTFKRHTLAPAGRRQNPQLSER